MSTSLIDVPGLGFGQADDAHRRLREDGGRHVGVVELGRAAIELGLGEGLAFADGDRRQRQAVGDVAHGPDVRDVGPGIFVDGDGALLVQLDARLVEAEVLGMRRAAGGEHHHLGLDLQAVA